MVLFSLSFPTLFLKNKIYMAISFDSERKQNLILNWAFLSKILFCTGTSKV